MGVEPQVTTAGNVADLVAEAARRWPDEVGLVDTAGEGELTWSALDAAVDEATRGLRAEGLTPGDRVALLLPASADFVLDLFATLRAGAIAVPLSPENPEEETRTLLEHSGARLLVTEGRVREAVPDGVRVLPPARQRAAAGGDSVEPAGAGEDIAVISYTSGTMGPPRGVMLAHRALLANVEQLTALDEPLVEHRDRVLLNIPLFHLYGLGAGLLTATRAGARVVLAQRFDAGQALAACAEQRITSIVGVPAMYAQFAAMPAEELGAGLATVRRMASGAAPLHPKVLAAIRAATGLDIYEGYGLTETAPALTSTLVTGYPKPGSVGRPLPGVELRLVGSDGEPGPIPLDPADPDDTFDEGGGTGLVAVRGANLFSGYWPDGAHGPDAEGWFRTGDVGYLDTDGDLHLVDRANDLIIVNGFNVFPHEVEHVIDELPEVVEVAVVGMLDERTGEAVKAVIVPARGAALSEQQVVDRCAERLPAYKVPRRVEFADELPHSPTGKLRRVRVR